MLTCFVTRRRQADMTVRILERRLLDRPVVVGSDMNDPPDAPMMQSLADAASGLIDGLSDATEDAPYALPEEDPPPGPVWTFDREAGHTSFRLFDHLWLQRRCRVAQRAAGILRRRCKTKDGSDHDPAWIDLDI